MSGLKRKLGGESFFITTFENRGQARATVGFSAAYPGKILPIDLSQGTIYCQRNSYLCSALGIEISAGFAKSLGAASSVERALSCRSLQAMAWPSCTPVAS